MLLSEVSQREHDKPLRRVILELSQEIFETPNWEVWSLKPSKAKLKTELIGQVWKVIISGLMRSSLFSGIRPVQEGHAFGNAALQDFHGPPSGSVQP